MKLKTLVGVGVSVSRRILGCRLGKPRINMPLCHLPHQQQSNFSQLVAMPALHFHTERLGLKDPESPENLRKEWGSVYAILRDYVQPDSTLSLDEAINRT